MVNEIRNEEHTEYHATPSWEAIPGTGMDGEDVIEAARRIIEKRWEHHRENLVIRSPADSRELVGRDMSVSLADHKNEVFGIVFLNTRHRVLSNEILFSGTVDGASVYPRVVVQRALELNAAAVVLYHNHPSGDPTPSMADEALTNRLKQALGLVDVQVLDHLIVAGPDIHSMAESGRM